MKAITKVRRAYNEIIIRQFSDTELVDKYNFMKKEIDITRDMRGFADASDIEFAYQLLKEIKKRGIVL